ncbi:MAG: M1 family aminopeptidase, partial [candidate division KSB1 bacterium]|nr:M1 family aminopeptidase [candidate division KSB1 bacterium]
VAANRRQVPLSTRPYEMDDLQYAALVYAQGGFVLNMLQDRYGEETFDRIMQTYFARWQFKHPTTKDFCEIVEEVTGEPADEFFRQWVYGSARADLRLARIETERGKENNTVRVFVENRGDAVLPAQVMLHTRDGKTLTQQWDGRSKEPLIFQAASCKSVVVDPNDAIPEVNNWNNSLPRRFQVRPFFAIPPFDQHLVLVMPTLWYDDDVDGWRPGLKLSGGNWRTFFPLLGFHEWHLGASYGTRSGKWNYSLGYGTHLYAGDQLLRFESGLRDLEGRVHAEAALSTQFAELPWRAPLLRLTAGWRYNRLYDLDYWETRTWSAGTVSAAKLSVEAETGGFLLQNRTGVTLLGGGASTGSDFSFTRLQVSSSFDWRAAKELQLNLRLFAGLTTGTPALQDRLYLYGGMEERGLLSPLVDGRGRFSPQERLQLPADGGNLRGYFGRYLSGDRLIAANAELSIPFMPIRFFFDAGSVWDSRSASADKIWRYDAGVSLPIGPLALHLPIWVSDPLPNESEFEFRWIVSLSVSSFRFAF